MKGFTAFIEPERNNYSYRKSSFISAKTAEPGQRSSSTSVFKGRSDEFMV